MLEKPTRPTQPDIQERQAPRTIQEILDRYDLDNIKIYEYLDGLVEELNQSGQGISREELIEELLNLIEQNIDYRVLSNKPSIEGITLINNKTFEQLGMSPLTNTELENLLKED